MDIPDRPLRANNGRERVQQWMHQKGQYSITSSARASSVELISPPASRFHATNISQGLASPLKLLLKNHSIISVTRTKNDLGMVKPSAFAVVLLKTRSNLSGCSTGMSAGFEPRRILST